MPYFTVMLVESDQGLRRELETTFIQHGLATIAVDDAHTAVELACQHQPNAIVASTSHPPMGGIDLCRQLQARPSLAECPLLIYASKYSPTEAAAALDEGAADYVEYTGTARELVARLRRRLRPHGTTAKPALLRVGRISVDTAACAVTCDDRPVNTTATEFRILHALAVAPGTVLSREKIVELIGGDGIDALDRTVDTHIKNIRKKLGSGCDELQTVRGFGYRLRGAADALPVRNAG